MTEIVEEYEEFEEYEEYEEEVEEITDEVSKYFLTAVTPKESFYVNMYDLSRPFLVIFYCQSD